MNSKNAQQAVDGDQKNFTFNKFENINKTDIN